KIPKPLRQIINPHRRPASGLHHNAHPRVAAPTAMKTCGPIVGQVANLRTDCQSGHPGAARTSLWGGAMRCQRFSTEP
ncbi:MAG: hypothetical protein ABSF22_03970, partial [Bryobacteraceae bacterium]